jgi:hypothetical protein
MRAYPQIPKWRRIAFAQGQIAKILANASMPDFSGASDIILGYALRQKGGLERSPARLACCGLFLCFFIFLFSF